MCISCRKPQPGDELPTGKIAVFDLTTPPPATPLTCTINSTTVLAAQHQVLSSPETVLAGSLSFVLKSGNTILRQGTLNVERDGDYILVLHKSPTNPETVVLRDTFQNRSATFKVRWLNQSSSRVEIIRWSGLEGSTDTLFYFKSILPGQVTEDLFFKPQVYRRDWLVRDSSQRQYTDTVDYSTVGSYLELMEANTGRVRKVRLTN
jgi:hypothetical protein